MAPIIAAILPTVLDAIGRAIPDPQAQAQAKLEVLKMQQSGDLATLDAELRLALAQIDVNKSEAGSESLFKSGWRPAVGWSCVLGLLYEFIVRPLLPWFVQVLGVQGVPELPPLDGDTLFGLLVGLLGIGTLRTVEKVKGKA